MTTSEQSSGAEDPRQHGSATADASQPKGPQRVLAMDGGGLLALVTLTVIQRLEDATPGFLKAVDLFAGTSAGGVNSVLLAAESDPAQALDACFALWDGSVDLWHTSPLHLLRALEGSVSLYGNQPLRAALEERLGQRTLGDLAHGVALMSFDLAGRENGTWTPMILSNIGAGRFHSEVLRAVDTALATSALPMTMPISNGYVDGGLYANNPSLGALSEILTVARGATAEQSLGSTRGMAERFAALAASDAPGLQGAIAPEHLQGLRILSVGTGAHPAFLEVLDAPWGWRQWMANAKDPARLVQVAHAGVEQSVDLYCQLILGSRGYHRVQPTLAEAVHPSHDLGAAGYPQILQRVREVAVAAGMAVDLEPTLNWLEAGGWG